MGFVLYVVCEDGEYVSFGKEIELYANYVDSVAMLLFLFSKMESGKILRLRRFGIHDLDEGLMKKDVTETYLAYAREELSIG